MIKAYKLYTGEDGHSHVTEGYLAEQVFSETISIGFKESPPGSTYGWHNAPNTQYVLCLSGTLEFKMHSCKTFRLNPGEVLIALDTTGSGHSWKLIDDQPWKRAYVKFQEEVTNFVEQSAD